MSTRPDLRELLVSFFLNTVSEVDDPEAALRHYFPAQPDFVSHMLGSWQGLARSNPAEFVALQRPEAGDASLRQWIDARVEEFSRAEVAPRRNG